MTVIIALLVALLTILAIGIIAHIVIATISLRQPAAGLPADLEAAKMQRLKEERSVNRPRTLSEVQNPAIELTAKSVRKWKKMHSAKHGRHYYIDSETGESTWKKPKDGHIVESANL